MLFDPPIYPASGDPLALDSLRRRFSIAARLRQERFETREELGDCIRRSPVLARLRPGVADLFALATLRPASDRNGYELRCPRKCEARVFEYIFAYNFEPDAESFACPVKVICGDPSADFSFLPSMDPSGIVGLDYDFVPETTHFLQLENPEECVHLVLEFLERQGLA